MGLFTDERLTMDVENLKTEVRDLKHYREVNNERHAACEAKHEQHVSHRRRQDDAINHNTEAQKQLAASIDKLTDLIYQMIERVDGSQSQIDFIKDWRTTFANNRRALSSIFWLLAGVSTVIGAYLVVKGLL